MCLRQFFSHQYVPSLCVNLLAKKSDHLYNIIPSGYQDAYYQLVQHPVKASANLNELYLAVAKNRLYAKQGRALTNDLAQKAQMLFDKDSTMSYYYNNILADGKWNHMMDQTHISYTYWQQPEKDLLPRVQTIKLPENADLGIAIDGSESWWPQEIKKAVLPTFDSVNKQSFYVDVYNRGRKLFDYTVNTKQSWITISSLNGTIDKQERLWVSIDWEKAPVGESDVPITIGGANNKVVVHAVVKKFPSEKQVLTHGFIENNGYVSINAASYSRKIDIAPVRWQLVPNLGRTGSAMTPAPVTATSQTPGEMCPRLEYDLALSSSGDVNVHAFVSPTLNYFNNQGLRFGVSIDDQPVQIVNIHENFGFQEWEQAMRRNVIEAVTTFNAVYPGEHVLKVWMIDPGIVLQKIVVDTGGLQPSYLGPPESVYLSEK